MWCVVMFVFGCFVIFGVVCKLCVVCCFGLCPSDLEVIVWRICVHACCVFMICPCCDVW